jgi:hypothetical protein
MALAEYVQLEYPGLDLPRTAPSQDVGSRVPPWVAERYRLVTWWDMLEFSGIRFFWAGYVLNQVISECYVASLMVDPNAPIYNLAQSIDERAKAKALDRFKSVRGEFDQLGLRISVATVDDALHALENEKRSFAWLLDEAKRISKLAEREIKGTAFFYVPAARVVFLPTYEEPHVFGEKVSNAFPSAIPDIYEAGTCLALGRGSACVFHLMRALEIGLRTLGAVFGVSLDHTNWGPAIEEIEARVGNMHREPKWRAFPDCKQLQESYSQIASHFGVLKNAWRNYTMHARGSYTEEQAELIFRNTKAFMAGLVEKGLKEK